MTPIHDWSRVDAGLFHHFHLQWIAALTDAFNSGALPELYWALIERDDCNSQPSMQSDAEFYSMKANRITVRKRLNDLIAVVEIVSPGNKHSAASIESFVKKAVEFLRARINLLIIDLFPPTSRDPQGLHQLIWERIENEPFELPADKPLTLASYSSGDCITAYIEPVGVGDNLPDMALFLTPDSYVPAPLGATYETTWNVCPQPLKNAVLAATS